MFKIPNMAPWPGDRPVESEYTILNAQEGVNGIYRVSGPDGEEFDAYCDMTTDGGHWILIARWAASPNKTITWGQVIVKDAALNTTTNSATLYPVIPTGVRNVSKEVLFKSAASGWVSRYGQWLKFTTTDDPALVITSSGIDAMRGSDRAIVKMHGESAGWGGNTSMTNNFSLWTQWGNGGPCGGAGVCGSQKICPVIRANYNYSCHFDFSSVKQLFIRSRIPE